MGLRVPARRMSRTLLPADVEADERLVANVLLGDRRAQREFAQRFQQLFQVVARRYFRDPVAGDASQDIFEKICKNDWAVLRQWDKRGPLPAYLAKVAKNNCLDILRRPQTEMGTGGADEDPDDRPWSDPESQAMASELLNCLKKALDALSETYRRIVWLRHIDGLKHDEIAERLGQSVGYVGPTLQRGEHYLRSELRERCKDHLGSFAALAGTD